MAAANTICVVDDDEAIRDSLDALLSSAGHSTVGFANAMDFLDASLGDNLSCILLDVRLPDGDGIDILKRLVNSGCSLPIIIITGHGDVPMAVRAMRLGATDFVEKPFQPDALLQTISDAIGSHREKNRAKMQSKIARELLDKLTPRETDVMRKLVIGQPNKVIAAELGLSPRTVEIHRAHVMEKTAAKSLSHLVRIAIAAGIDPDI